MTMMPPTDPRSPTYPDQQAAIWREIRALWARLGSRKTVGQLGLCLVQPDEPEDVEVGTLWFDTDEPT